MKINMTLTIPEEELEKMLQKENWTRERFVAAMKSDMAAEEMCPIPGAKVAFDAE